MNSLNNYIKMKADRENGAANQDELEAMRRDIARLTERVRVLETIATDKDERLRDEIRVESAVRPRVACNEEGAVDVQHERSARSPPAALPTHRRPVLSRMRLRLLRQLEATLSPPS